MDLGKLGIWSSGLRRVEDDGQVRETAAELEELGFSALFIPGGTGGDDLLTRVAQLLSATRGVPVLTGILNVWMHEPGDVASRFAALERDHPGRFQLGLGISHAPLVDRRSAGRYQRPLQTMRRYLDDLDVPGERVLLAALGPKMLELACIRTAGSHPYFTPVEHTRYAREALGQGAMLAVEQTVVLETDPAKARAMGREFMDPYLRLPNYVNNLLRHGFTEEDTQDGGSDRLVDAIVAWGDETAIAERVAQQHAAGADHVCIQVVGPKAPGLALQEWRRLAPRQ